jgi:Fe-S-cluster-containing dehydrogenase component
MTIDRREFLRAGLVGVAACATLAPAPSEARENHPVPDNAIGLLYDSTLCIGCKACQSACKTANELPLDDNIGGGLWDSPIELSGKTYTVIKLYSHGTMEAKDHAENGFAHIKRQCLHCADPSCVSACPVSAMQKDPQIGIVTYNADACIGCRYCVAACPFGVPQFQYDTPIPKIAKCQLCKHLLADGKIPACAQACPTGATLFGTYPALSEEIDRRKNMEAGIPNVFPRRTVDSGDTHERPAAQYTEQVYGQKELGGTQVRYLAGIPFDKFGLPVGLPERSYAAQSETLQHTLYGGLAAPAVVLAGLITAAWRGSKDHHDDDHEGGLHG